MAAIKWTDLVWPEHVLNSWVPDNSIIYPNSSLSWQPASIWMFSYYEETCTFMVSDKNLRMPSQSCFRLSDSRVFQSFHRLWHVSHDSHIKSRKGFQYVLSLRKKLTWLHELVLKIQAVYAPREQGLVLLSQALFTSESEVRDPSEGWTRVCPGTAAHSQTRPAQPYQHKYLRQSYNQTYHQAYQ